MQPLAISPILLLLAGAVAALVVGIFLPRRRQTWNAAFAAVILLAAAALVAMKLADPPGLVFSRSFAMDRPILIAMLVLFVAGLFCILLSVPLFRNDAREAEYYALLMFALLGAVMLAGAHDVMGIVLGVLLTSVPSYAMVAYRRSSKLAMEALLKYYLFGALLNIGLIYGLVLLYGLSGSTILGELTPTDGGDFLFMTAVVLVLAGLGFKAGYVPSHFWIPDVYQGTTIPVATFLSIVPKIAAVLILARLVSSFPPDSGEWPPIVAGISALAMTGGNLAAFRQIDIRRLLAYSTIAQTGYLLMAVVALYGSNIALSGLLYYFAAYAAANIGAFAVLAATGLVTIDAHRGLVRTQPWLAVAMLISLMSLMGLPPLAGFVAKFILFMATMDAGYTWLMIVGLINSVLSLYYYLRIIAPMFVSSQTTTTAAKAEPVARGVAVACAILSVTLGIAAFLLLDSSPTVTFGA